MTIRPALLAAAGLSLALGGCMGTENRGLESVHQPIVDRADYALDLQTAGRGLASGERARLEGWLDAMQLGYGDRVTVDGGSGAARGEIGGVVAGYGLLIADGPSPAAAPVAPGAVRVTVGRMRASTPGCPDWSRSAAPDFDQHTSSNYGCAINGNLAAMVANPGDLVRGQTGSTAVDPVLSTKAIKSYRDRVPSGSGGLAAPGAGGSQ